MRAIRLRLMQTAFLLSCCSLANLPAAAQTLPEDECAQLEDPEAEITCLRAVLTATRQAQQAAQPAPSPATSNSAQVGQVAPVSAPAPARDAPVSNANAELGSEQIAGAAFAEPKPEDREATASTITDYRTDRNGRLIMQLDNGQIWRQVEILAVPIRITADDRVRVEITRSGFGGYRMEFLDMNRRISVARER